MRIPKKKSLTKTSQTLRCNLTKEERHLWYDFLKDYPVQFNRQKVIGNYIVDFYCFQAKLIVELDGSQHFEEEALIYDEQRTEYFTQ
jgi:very-short-patch-repair endonuclease